MTREKAYEVASALEDIHDFEIFMDEIDGVFNNTEGNFEEFYHNELFPLLKKEMDRQEHIYFLSMRTMNWYGDGIMFGIEEDANSNVRTWEELYFETPTQVALWDENQYVGGIAYKDEIICGCCGGTVKIDEIIEFAPSDVKPIIDYHDWIPFDDEILADEQKDFNWDYRNEADY